MPKSHREHLPANCTVEHHIEVFFYRQPSELGQKL